MPSTRNMCCGREVPHMSEVQHWICQSCGTVWVGIPAEPVGASPVGMPPEAAEHYVVMLEFAAAAMHFVTEPGAWAGYVAWLEQFDPHMPPETSSEEVRGMMAADARWFTKIAASARGKLSHG